MKPSLSPLRSLISSLSLVAVTGVGMLAAELDDKAAAFAKLANGVIEQTVVGKLDVPAVSKDLNAMEDLASWFANQYKAKHPAGAKLMDYMLAKKDSLHQMSLADIDAQFESEAITKAHGKEIGLDLTVEDNEHFGNPVDLFVHPATSYICAQAWDKEHKAEQLKRIQSELQEVVEHCQKVVAKLR
jgi:hypothetical protein